MMVLQNGRGRLRMKAREEFVYPLDAANDAPITAGGIAELWRWAGQGCPEWVASDAAVGIYKDLREAVTTTNQLYLGALSYDPHRWVRLGVAGNFHTPPWAMWGDGRDSFGLAGDSDRWIRATVLSRMPKPPSNVLAAMLGTTRMTPNGSVFVPAS